MKAVIIVLAILIALMMVVCYALFVVVGRIDEQEERMHREWKESNGADDERL